MPVLMQKKWLHIILCLLASMSVWAVPARQDVVIHTQSDGTRLMLRLVGDEYQHYFLDITTGAHMLQGEDGDYYVLDSELSAQQTAAAAARRNASDQRRVRRLSAAAPSRWGVPNAYTGNKKGIVILAEFSDRSFLPSHSRSIFDAMFNAQGYSADGHIGSVADYFRAQSYGHLSIDFDVVGPVPLTHPMVYYGANNDKGNDVRAGHMVREACELADLYGVDFSQYDWDGDGNVEQVFVVFSGYGENFVGADPNTIWPHEWNLNSSGASSYQTDGVVINTYACAAELHGSYGDDLCGIGTAVHEFSHCLGYPDVYDTGNSGGVGMSFYDVMCMGSYNGPGHRGQVPAGFSAYQRWMAGWLRPIELKDPATVTNMPSLDDSPVAYMISNPANENEFLLFENRSGEGYFSYFANDSAGHGLLVTHIDYSEDAWRRSTPNNVASHQRISWVPADKHLGQYDDSTKNWTITRADHKADFFPGTDSVTTFIPSQWTAVGAAWFNTSTESCSSHVLSDIVERNGRIDFRVDGGDIGIRYTLTFNPGSGTCALQTWTQTVSNLQVLQLPSATMSNVDWTFVGWTRTPVTESTKRPVLCYAGESYVPTGSYTLYAVYAYTQVDDAAGTKTVFYDSAPPLVSLPTPVVTFTRSLTSADTICVGDQYSNSATATCPDVVLPSVTYESSRPAIATVDSDGVVSAHAVGSVTITAVVNAVPDQNRRGWNAYDLRIIMPRLTSIRVATPPTQLDYVDGDAFVPTGMRVLAGYHNGHERAVSSYSWSPQVVSNGDTCITISYTEGGVTTSTLLPIHVKPRARYKAMFHSVPGTCPVDSLVETSYRGGFVLPTCEDASDDWNFVGWSRDSLGEPVATAPNLLQPNEFFQPEEDVAFYAVYLRIYGTEYMYRPIQSVDDLTEGAEVLISSSFGQYGNKNSRFLLANLNRQLSNIHIGLAADTSIVCNDPAAKWTIRSRKEGTWYFENEMKSFTFYQSTLFLSSMGQDWKVESVPNENTLFYITDTLGTNYVSSTSFGPFTIYRFSDSLSFAQQQKYVGLQLFVRSFSYAYHSMPCPHAVRLDTIMAEAGRSIYGEGEIVSPDSLMVTAHFNDGSSYQVSDFSYSPTGLLMPDDSVITISYTHRDIVRTTIIPITVIPLPDYTVTFSIAGYDSTLTEPDYRCGVEVPTVTAPDGFVFMGWVDSPVYEPLDQAPKTDTLPRIFHPSSDTTFYALFAKIFHDEERWTETHDQLVDGVYAVLTAAKFMRAEIRNRALLGSSEAPVIEDSVLLVAPDEDCRWTFMRDTTSGLYTIAANDAYLGTSGTFSDLNWYNSSASSAVYWYVRNLQNGYSIRNYGSSFNSYTSDMSYLRYISGTWRCSNSTSGLAPRLFRLELHDRYSGYTTMPDWKPVLTGVDESSPAAQSTSAARKVLVGSRLVLLHQGRMYSTEGMSYHISTRRKRMPSGTNF